MKWKLCIWPHKRQPRKDITPLEQRRAIEEQDRIKIRWFEEQEGLIRHADGGAE